jgi:transcription termination factor NusB
MEIEEQEYKRLKSREEKLMAYYEWYVDKENDLATVEDIVNKNIKLEEENRKLKESLDIATKCSSKEED